MNILTIVLSIALIGASIAMLAVYKHDTVLKKEVVKMRKDFKKLMDDYQTAYIAMLSVMDTQDAKIEEMERVVGNVNNYVQTFKNTPVRGKHVE